MPPASATEPGGFIDPKWEAEHAAELAAAHEAAPTVPDKPGDVVATVGGERVYIQGSTPRDFGFHTEKEYLEAQRYSDYPYGTHEGKMVPEDTVIITTKEGKPYQRFRTDKIPQSLSPLVERRQYKIPIINYEARQVLLSPNDVEVLNTLQGEAKFYKYKELNLLPRKAKFEGADEKGNIKYSLPEIKPSGEKFTAGGQSQKSRESALDLLKSYKTKEGGYDLTQALYKGVPVEVLEAVGWEKGAITQAMRRAEGLKLLEPYKRGKTWDISGALAEWKIRPDLVDAVKLLFKPEDIERAIEKFPTSPEVLKKQERVITKIQEYGKKFNVPPGVIAAAVGSLPVAVAEPTPIGEIALLALLVAGAVIGGIKAGKGARKALETPRPSEVGKRITEPGRVTPFEKVDIPLSIETFPRVETELKVKGVPKVYTTPKLEGVPKVETGLKIQGVPKVEIEPKLQGIPKEETTPKLLIAETATAVKGAKEGLSKTIIRPKVLTPGELDRLWATKTSLEALDVAIIEASQRGQLTDDEVREYHQARSRYLTKRQLLDKAMQTYIGGMQPQLTGKPLIEVSSLASLAYLTTRDSLTRALAKGKSLSQAALEAQALTEASLQNAVKTKTFTKTAVKTAAKEAVREATRTAIAEAIAEATATKTTTAERAATVERTAELTRIKIPPGLPLRKKAEKAEEWTPEEIKSAIAWKDGFVVHAIKSPYRRGIDEQTFHIRNLPAGLQVLDIKGKGSQQASARITGRAPNRLTVDVGNQDVLISRAGRGRVRLSHSRDTRGTISQTTISKKRGRIYKTAAGGGTIISRRPLRGYRA